MSTGHHRGVYSRIDVGVVLVYTTPDPGSSDAEGLEAALSLEEKEEVVSRDWHSGRSLMNSRNDIGPITPPCGTPDITWNLVETVHSRITCCDTITKKSAIHPSCKDLGE